MQTKEHWETVYTTKSTTAVSWFQECATRSLQLINSCAPHTNAKIIDVGGGASTLVDDLINVGYFNITVLDISGVALNVARQRLGEKAEPVKWIEGDITQLSLPRCHYDIWHDRAVFHFLIDAKNRQAYVKQLTHALKPGGQLIISTFAETGPQQCSNLPVVRYSPEALQTEFGELFVLQEHTVETHITPSGSRQEFVYCRFTCGH